MMHPFDHASAASPEQAVALLGVEVAPDAPYDAAPTRLIAGGTDLIPLMRERLAAPTLLIDLKPIRQLRAIRREPDGTIVVGGLATLADLERDPVIAAELPILAAAVRDAATPQLRNAATVGGNLLQRNRCWYFRGEPRCWLKGGDECFARAGRNDHHAVLGTRAGPCLAVHPSDLAPALVALDAAVTAHGPRGERTLPVAELLQPPTDAARIEHRLTPDELIVAVRVPPQPAGSRGVYLKAMERAAWSFALASAAAQLTLRDGRVERARLVLGGVAAVPWRVPEAEALLEGQPLTPELAARAAARAVAGAAPLAHNAYKVPLARELARRALLQAAGEVARRQQQ
jgi:xanthine dehydrogenase YagS FAD-binding subunit